MSLVDRTKHFLREFPSAHLKPCTLRQVYKKYHITRKKYRWYKEPANPNPVRDRKCLANVRRQLTRARNEGRRAVFIDETIVSRKCVRDLEWSRSKENPTLDQAKLDEPTLAILAAISKEKGLEYF